MVSKVCKVCKEVKSENEFYKGGTRECKSCAKERDNKRKAPLRKYFYENKEVILEEHKTKTKVCSCCKKELPFSAFAIRDYTKDYREARCRVCLKKVCKKSWENNKTKNEDKLQDKINKIIKQQELSDEKQVCKTCGELKHITEYRVLTTKGGRSNFRGLYCKSCQEMTDSERKHFNYMKNREYYIEQQKAYNKKKYYENKSYRVLSNLRTRLHTVVTKSGKIKADTTMNLVGCSEEQLCNYLESLFLDGMSWDNKSEWHIDHIIPCSYFDFNKEEDQRICFHYLNLQPLWEEDNRNKMNTIPVDVEDRIEIIREMIR